MDRGLESINFVKKTSKILCFITKIQSIFTNRKIISLNIMLRFSQTGM